MKYYTNQPFYLIAGIIFLAIYFLHPNGDIESLNFLLKPTEFITNILSGSESVYLIQKGYFYPDFNIIINASCSGYQFWLVSFLLISYYGIKYSPKQSAKFLSIPIALIGGYILTVIVNSGRIIASIIVQNQANHFLPERPHLILHDITGIVVNITSLMLLYLLITYILKSNRHYEGLA